MPIDRALADALKTAAEEEGQPHAVAQRLIAWVESLSVGDVADGQQRFYENVRAVLVAEGAEDED